MTWKYLLELPLNKEAFTALLNRGVHPNFKNLHKRLNVESSRVYNKLVRLFSAVSYWSPIFAEVDFMPRLMLPFIKLISTDDLLVFEIILSLIVQWMQVWFEAFPSEPASVVQAIDHIVRTEDPRLSSHLSQLGLGCKLYAWPLMTNFFADVLPKEDWLKLIDNLFINKHDPELLVYFCASFIINNKH